MHGHNTHKYIFHLDEAWSWMDGTGSMSPMANYHQRPTGGRIQCTATPIASDNIMKSPVGATAYIGPPAKPIPKELSDAIGARLGKIPEIFEAHLPMVYIKRPVDPPAQVLVIFLEENSTNTDAKIVEVLSATLPTNSYLDFTESRPDDPNLATIRATGTQFNLNRKLN